MVYWMVVRGQLGVCKIAGMNNIMFLSSVIFFVIGIGLSILVGENSSRSMICFIIGKVMPVVFLGLSGGVLIGLLISSIFN